MILAAAALACVLGGAAAFSLTDHVSFWLALYWAVATASTVGYGDVTPRTGAAHIAAVVMMLTAIPCLGGSFAAATAAHVHKRVGHQLDRHAEKVGDHVDRALAARDESRPERGEGDGL